MHLGVVHTIRDRAAWDRVVSGEPNFPPGFVLLGSITQDDVSRAICIWDAPNLDDLQSMPCVPRNSGGLEAMILGLTCGNASRHASEACL